MEVLMTASIFIDGRKLFLNPFIARLAANVVDALIQSLKVPEGERAEFVLTQDSVSLTVDEDVVELKHAQTVITRILRALIESLHGAEGGTEYRIVYELRSQESS